MGEAETEEEGEKSRWHDWFPEALFLVLVLGGSLAWVFYRFWPW